MATKGLLWAVLLAVALYGASADEERRGRNCGGYIEIMEIQPLFGPGIRLRGGSVFQVARPQPHMLHVIMDGPRLSFSASGREEEAPEAMEGPRFNMVSMEQPENDPIMDALNDWMSRKAMRMPMPLAFSPLMAFGPRRPFMLNDPVMDLIRLHNLRKLHKMRPQDDEEIRSEGDQPTGELGAESTDMRVSAGVDNEEERQLISRVERPVVATESRDANEQALEIGKRLPSATQKSDGEPKGFEAMMLFLQGWFLALGIVASVLLLSGFAEMVFCSSAPAVEEPSVTVLSAPGLDTPLLQTYTVTYVNEPPTKGAGEAGAPMPPQ